MVNCKDGWRCPSCAAIYSPYVETCVKCSATVGYYPFIPFHTASKATYRPYDPHYTSSNPSPTACTAGQAKSASGKSILMEADTE